MAAYDKYQKMGAFHWRLLSSDGTYRVRVDTVLRYVKPSHVCLDLGCGDGAYLGAVAKKCGLAVGVDIDKLGIKLAKAKCQEARILNAEAIWSDFKDALHRLNGRKFDVVYSMDVVEHLKVPGELLDLARAATRENGVFLLGTPLYAGRKNFSPYHVHEYTMSELLKLVEKRFRLVNTHRLPCWMRKDGTVSPDRFAILVLRKKL